MKLTDLELSSVNSFVKFRTLTSTQLENESGSSESRVLQPYWTAPEVLANSEASFTTASDCYSLGMVIWEILTGEIPLADRGLCALEMLILMRTGISAMRIEELVTRGVRPSIPNHTPPGLEALLKGLWSQVLRLTLGSHAHECLKNPQDRPSARDTLLRLTALRESAPKPEKPTVSSSPPKPGRHRRSRSESGLSMADFQDMRYWERAGRRSPATDDVFVELPGQSEV